MRILHVMGSLGNKLGGLERYNELQAEKIWQRRHENEPERKAYSSGIHNSTAHQNNL